MSVFDSQPFDIDYEALHIFFSGASHYFELIPNINSAFFNLIVSPVPVKNMQNNVIMQCCHT